MRNKMIIVSFNFNAWMPVTRMPYLQKIKKFAAYLKEKYANNMPAIIALQEYITGGGKYLENLEAELNGAYIIVTPPDFSYEEHPKSIVTVTLLRKDIIQGCEVKSSLGACLANRVVDIEVSIEGQSWRIINMYAVQIANFTGQAEWYIEKRQELHDELWKQILLEAKNYQEERLILLGDFQESEKGKHIKQLYELGFKEKVHGFPTVRNDFFTEETSIDHILFSEKAWKEFSPVSFELDAGLLDELSDHCMLVAVSA